MNNILVVGMPNSGKSTFIAALRHIFVADQIATELVLTGLADSEAHLNRLEDDWLACERMKRTKAATEGWVTFNVRDREHGLESSLLIPDLRGEAFEQPASTGQCSKELFNALLDSEGILLFTNADREDDMLLISQLSDMFVAEDEEAESEADQGENLKGGTHHQPFKPESMPEEVKVVEFLQVANRRPQRSRKRKIAVVISAWDVVIGSGNPAPFDWLMGYRPMLHQFLTSNECLWELRTYGVSAQGGKLPAMKKELEEMAIPSKRILIDGHGALPHDLSAPLRWLMKDLG